MEMATAVRTLGCVYRSEIIEEEESLTNKNINDYSKSDVVWKRTRPSVEPRQYVYCSDSICKRAQHVPVTESNSPFCVPESKSQDVHVIATVGRLNERYMFVSSGGEEDALTKICGAIDWACVSRFPVKADSVAYMMLGMEGAQNDVTVLSSLLDIDNYGSLEWKAIPSAEPYVQVPVVAGKLSPRACVCVQRYGVFVLQHIAEVHHRLYDIQLQSREVDVEQQETELESPVESSSGWDGVSSDAASRRWSGGADLSRDVRVSIVAHHDMSMRDKMKTMLSPLMFKAVDRLRMCEKSWLVLLYFIAAAVIVAMLRYALPNFEDTDGARIYFANFGPSLFSYGITWLTIRNAANVWYEIYMALTEQRRNKVTSKWEKRCKIAIVCGSVFSFASAAIRTKQMIDSYPHMILNVWVFVAITFALWLLNIVQICVVSYGITGYMFTCRMSKYDIQESKITERNFSRFTSRCAKMHKFRLFAFSIIFFSSIVCVAFLIFVYQGAVRMKFFVFLPYGVILPHIDNNTDEVGPVVYLLVCMAPYVTIFLRTLYASLWASKAKADRQVQLNGDLNTKFVASPSIAGWCLFHLLVRHQLSVYALLTRNVGYEKCKGLHV